MIFQGTDETGTAKSFKDLTKVNGTNKNAISYGLTSFFGERGKEGTGLSANDVKSLKSYNAELTNLRSTAVSTGQAIDEAAIASKAFDATMTKSSSSAQTIAKEAGAAGVAMNGLTRSSKAAALGMNLLASAGNMLLMLAITEVISLVVNHLQDLANEAQDAREAVDAAFSESSSSLSDLKEQKDTVESLSESYEKLSKGVNTSNNQNITLSDANYEEYLDTCNQIAELFPDLVTGYDSQGNAILSLKGNVDGLTEAYTQAQQAAYALAWTGVENDEGDFEGGIADVVTQYEYATDKVDAEGSILKRWGANNSRSNYTTPSEKIKKYREFAQIDYDTFVSEYNDALKMSYGGNSSELVGITSLLSEADVDVNDLLHSDNPIQAWAEAKKKMLEQNETYIADLEEAVGDARTSLEGYMKGVAGLDGTLKSGYDALTTTQQSMADYMLGGLSADDLELLIVDDDEDATARNMENYVNGIVDTVSSMSGVANNAYKKLVDAIANPDELKSLDLKTIDGYLDTLSDEMKISKDKLKEMFNIEDVFETETTFDNIKKSFDELTDSRDDYTKGTTDGYDTISSAAKKYNKTIKTEKQAVEWLKYNSASMTNSQKKMFIEAYNEGGNLVDVLKRYNDALNEINLTSLSVDIDGVTTAVTNLNTALSESSSATGLTEDSISNIKSMFSGLDEYDESTLFENTATGIHLNEEALRKLNNAYDEQNRSEIDAQLENLKDQYNELTDSINECDVADTAQLATLYTKREAILDQIDEVQALASQYDGLMSAFNQWNNAKDASSPGDNYDSIVEYLDTADELAANGLWGQSGFREYLEMLTGKDLSSAGVDELSAAWEGLDNKISGTSYSIASFLKSDETGVENFVSALHEMNSEWAYLDDNGNWEFDINLEEVAAAFGTDVSFIQTMLDKLEEYGWKVYVDSTDLELTKTAAEDANEYLKDLGKTDYTFNFAADLDDIDTEIAKAQEIFNQFLNDDGSVNVDVDGAAEAQQVLQALLLQKQALSQPTFMSINVESLGEDQSEIMLALQGLQNQIDGYQVGVEVKADTSSAQTGIVNYLDAIDKLPSTVQTDLGFDDSDFQNAVANIRENINVGIQPDQSDIDYVEQCLADISPEMLASVGIDTESINEVADSTASSIQNALTATLNNITFETDENGVIIGVSVDDEAARSELASLQANANSINGTAKVDADTASADTKISSTQTKLNDMVGTYTAYASASVSGEEKVTSIVDKLKGAFQKIGAGIWVAKANANSTTTSSSSKKSGDTLGAYHYANGSLHAFARGTDVTVGRNQRAVVNELGEEAVIRNGILYKIPGGMQTIDLKSGDIVINHKQLEELDKNGYVTSNGGRAQLIGGFARGTFSGMGAFYNSSGNSGAFKKSNKTYGSSKSSSSKSSSSSGKSSSSNSSNNSSNSSSSSSASEEAEETLETIDWIEVAISRLERDIDNLDKTVSATYKSWSDRSSALSQEMSKVTSEISMQQQAYNRYIKQANSVGLSSDLAAKVQNGTIDINDYDSDTADLIKDYQDWYEKALDCADAVIDLKDDLYDLAETNFDNLVKQFENQIDVIEHSVNLVEGYIDQAETRGYLASTDYYKTLIDLENKNISSLQDEFNTLSSTLASMTNSGQLVKYSEAWYDLYSQICDVEEALQDATNALYDYKSEMQELEWSYFETQEDYITNFADEAEWLVDLLENQGKLVDDYGNITNLGTATTGLHAQNYNVYMAQANDYAEQITKLNKQLAEDPYNTDLISKKQEYIEAQRDAIDAAYDERDAVKDLISDAYDAQLDYLQELIDKRTDLLDAEKD